MAKVYDALKRLEEERTLLEQSARSQTRNGVKPATCWSTWFRRGRQPALTAVPVPDRQVLDRLEKLASDVESVRLARKTNASDVEARLDLFQAQIDELQAEVKELEQRLRLAVSTTADGLRSRFSEISNRLLLIAAISVLALCVALLKS
ncbi:MAG: hypothetical protein HY270_09035 [Deltaproteobacteria bacterium]|nr:hypothetical protein [Deltaproteobacteria bacterium]